MTLTLCRLGHGPGSFHEPRFYDLYLLRENRITMSRRLGLILFVLLAVFFLIINRGAYRGFFENDDLSTLGWTPDIPVIEYLKVALSPLYQANNFRPVGHFYYRVMENFFRLDFSKYIVGLHLFHLLNVYLLWLVLRRLGSNLWPAAMACIFFAFQMAMFEAFWKPMYVFDVLCGTFCLLSILAFSHRYWLLSFIAFWLAYKSKEIAVMLPVALAAYEYWFGKREWKRLAPFFVVSLSFGIQGLLLNPNRGKDNNYTFHFTLAALARTGSFYAPRLFLIPYIGFLVPVAALFHRNRRTWFGLIAMGVFFFPLLFLPGRLHGAYCYVPFIGLAVALSGIAEAAHPAIVATLLLLWAPLDLRELRQARRAAGAVDDEVREWFRTLQSFARVVPRIDAAIYAGTPAGVDRYGVEGALKYLFPSSEVAVSEVDGDDAARLRQRDRLIVLNWDRAARQKLQILFRTPQTRDVVYMEVNPNMPLWQLGDGWYGREGAYCWIAPDASARLYRPADAHQFQLRVNVPKELLARNGSVTLWISLNNRRLGPHRFELPGWQETRWNLEDDKSETTFVKFHVEPDYWPAGSRRLGIAIGAFGFRTPSSDLRVSPSPGDNPIRR